MIYFAGIMQRYYKNQYLQYFDGEVVFVGVSELAHISLFNTSQLTNTVRDVRNIL